MGVAIRASRRSRLARFWGCGGGAGGGGCAGGATGLRCPARCCRRLHIRQEDESSGIDQLANAIAHDCVFFPCELSKEVLVE